MCKTCAQWLIICCVHALFNAPPWKLATMKGVDLKRGVDGRIDLHED